MATAPHSPTARDRFRAAPDAHCHAVQFYDDETFLFGTVAAFLAAGVSNGDRLLVIATPGHRIGFERALEGVSPLSLTSAGQVTFLDAQDTLDQFMVDGTPDPALFHGLFWRLLAQISVDALAPGHIRAYGEMVDLLWQQGNSRGAIRLEELWNDAGKRHAFSLMCAYSMGRFYKEGDAAQFMDVCSKHSHVLPTESFVELTDTSAQLREIALLQQRARSLEAEVAHRKDLETALLASLERETMARAHAEASDAFKEVFLDALGRDLRSPLNAVLTTARLMVVRDGLREPSHTRLRRIVTSAERIDEMIRQLMDVTRARLDGGIPVVRSDEDVVALVEETVEELRENNPDRTFRVRASAPCIAFIDAGRIAQVVYHLVTNALAHGNTHRPIEVDIESHEAAARIRVHSHGPAIAAEALQHLFDPFERTTAHPQSSTRVTTAMQRSPEARSLGLGLYICQRIVAAHAGTITVQSSEGGTRFDVSLPQAEPAPPISHILR